MDNNERCIICGDIFSGDDVKIYCPDCGAPMHKDCFEVEGRCPNTAAHYRSASSDGNGAPSPVRRERHFADGSGCEICGRSFSEDDEKVYCPDCGTAMHRLCYNMTHRCPYADEHTPRPYFTGNVRPARRNEKPVCDRCGKDLDNGEQKVYCPICGTPVHKSCWENEPVCPNEDRHAEGYDWEKENAPKPSAVPPKAVQQELMFESFSDMIIKKPICSPDSGEELTCNGVKQTELVHFLGINNFSTPRFFTTFMNMANSGKVVSFNLSAWFFMPLYHFYRRMTGPAVILTLASFILSVPTLMNQFIYMTNPESGVPDIPIISLANITYYIMLAVRVMLLLFNDYIYMRWSVNKILSLRERYKDAPADEYYAALEHSGNPKMMYVLGGISLMMLLVYMLNLFMNVSGLY